MNTLTKTSSLVLGGGCYWGMEQLFGELRGVIGTEAGYAGGQNDNPTYYNHPGHAEVIKVDYNASLISLQQLLDFFFTIHDPTTLNQQGNDIGSSYRSVIFYSNDQEKQVAKDMIKLVNDSGEWQNPVVTTLEPLSAFHVAEPEHQDYLARNPGGYTCHYRRLKTYLD